MAERDNPKQASGLSRRDFIQTVAAGGAGLLLSQTAFSQAGGNATQASPRPAPPILTNPGEIVNLGLIGAGTQGRVLLEDLLRPGIGLSNHNIKIKAVCDIWEYKRKYAQRYLKALKHGDVAPYEDYREMLADAKKLGLDGVIVATPDWVHAEQTIAALEAGLHCYCEAEMATTLDDARRMVQAARRTGKLLQIGRQTRSNPRYRFAFEELVQKRQIFGRLAVARAQWNNSYFLGEDKSWPRGAAVTPEVLTRYGYESMHHLCNWPWYRKYGSGPAVRQGGQQIDVMNWFLENRPASLMASGIRQPGSRHEWCQDVMCILEYDTPERPLMASFQSTSAISGGSHFETFQGHEGELTVAENSRLTQATSRDTGMWREWVEKKLLVKKPVAARPPLPALLPGNIRVELADVHETIEPEDFTLPVEVNVAYHWPHLQNFCDAIRKGTPLNCPGEVGYAGLVAALAINRAVETGGKVTFKPEDFVVA